jgi:phage-related protein
MIHCVCVSFFIHSNLNARELTGCSSRVLEIRVGPGTGAGVAERIARDDRRTIGRDIARVRFGWPVGLPLCRALGGGLWEVRSSLPSKREARVFFGFHQGMLIALHAIIKKARKAPADDLGLAKQRLKEVQSWREKTRI